VGSLNNPHISKHPRLRNSTSPDFTMEQSLKPNYPIIYLNIHISKFFKQSVKPNSWMLYNGTS
jgi:hypothetical protein